MVGEAQESRGSAGPDEQAARMLRNIAVRCGTPTYAYDLSRLRLQVARLQTALPSEVRILYSLKANPSLGLCGVIAGCGLGADVASTGELVTALEAGFPPGRIFASGPYKSPEMLCRLASLPGVILSVDSLSELMRLARSDCPFRALLRLRPDFASAAVVPAGAGSRFGVPFEDLPRCRDYIGPGGVELVGFHVFCGSQVLDAAAVVRHLRASLELSLRAAERLEIVPAILNLGGGFGVPYAPGEEELDLGPIGAELATLLAQAGPGGRPPARIVLELGRYLVAQAGWYLTAVVGHQSHQGRPAVVVDGGTHQRADLCGVGLRAQALPPLRLDGPPSPLVPTDVLGCLSAPGDVLAEAAPLPPLACGDVLAFPNAGAYGLCASPTLFHCSPVPAEVAFDGTAVEVIRGRQTADGLLEGQTRLAAAPTARSVR
jgi:diaminopimelate decarboxylase